MSKQIRVLVVEDSEDDALLLIRELKRGGYEPEFERVDTPGAMNTALDSRKWDIVISDYMMPRFNGLEALKLLKKKEMDIPFIIVSGKIGEDVAIDVMKVGAQDYINKGNLARLIPAIEREIIEAQVRIKRKLAEEALRNSERELNESQRVAQVGSWQWMVASDTITWSPGYHLIIGRDLALPPPNYKEHLKMYTQESAARLDAAVEKALNNGTPYELDLELLHPDGSHRYMIARGEAVRNAAGIIAMLRGTLQDITQLKQGEEALRESEERFRKIFENNHAIMLLIDSVHGKLIDANPAACNYYGYTKEQFIKELDISDINILPKEEIIRNMMLAASGDKNYFNFKHKLANGDIRDVEVYSGKINIKNKDFLFSIVHDITQRKQAEEELKKYHEHLEELVKERTAELKTKNEELERFNKLFVGRELRMIELKKKITDLEKKIAELEKKIG